MLGPAIAAWMRELDDGRGFKLVRGFPASDYSEAEAAIVYWLIGLHIWGALFRKIARVRC